jgi:hypothetical protein
MKHKWLFIFFLSAILISTLFSIMTLADSSEPHKSFELFPGWNYISVTNPMVAQTISDMLGTCGGEGKGIPRAWTYDRQNKKWIFMRGTDDSFNPGQGIEVKNAFPSTFVGNTLWLWLDGSSSCEISCGVDGCEGDDLVPDQGEVVCEPEVGDVPVELPSGPLVSSSFNAHDNGDISLILFTPENTLCKISYNEVILEDNFGQKRACENIDDEDYLTSELTRKHRCKIRSANINSEEDGSLQWTKRKEVVCKDENDVFKGFLLYTVNVDKDGDTVTGLDLSVREFEVTDGRRIVKKDSEKNFENLTSEEHPGLRELKITIVKGPQAVGREEPANYNLIWTTDRNAACDIKGDLDEYDGGTPDSTEHTSEVDGDEGSNIYVLCRDEDNTHKNFKFRIDRTAPAVIEDLAITAEEDAGKYKMKLTWTSRGDLDSKIRKYDVRYAVGIGYPELISTNNWYDKTKLEGGDLGGQLPDPIKDEIEIGDEVVYETKSVFEPDKVYTFAIRAEDGAGNMGPVSGNIKCLNNNECIPRNDPFPNVVMIETES